MIDYKEKLKHWLTVAILMLLVINIYGLNCHALASDKISIPAVAVQGDAVKAFVPLKSVVQIQNKPWHVGGNGLIIFGVPRNQEKPIKITVLSNQKTTSYTVSIRKKQFDIQRINGLSGKYVTPNPSQQAKIKSDQEKIKSARNQIITHDLMNNNGFIKPATGRISGVFGSQRILNGAPKNPHYGMDIANKIGTRVIAPAGGIVVLTDETMFLTGKTIMLDHGAGVYSVFIHLNTIDVKNGQQVKQGDKIGSIGVTGRSSGAHLHWGVTIAGVPVDPVSLLMDR